MGKYASTRAFDRDRKRSKDSSANTFAGSADYLTEVPKDESQFMLQNFLYNSDPTGIYRGFIATRDTMNYWNDYFANTGLNWGDVRYPSMMSNFGSMTYGSTLGTIISKNVHRLYR